MTDLPASWQSDPTGRHDHRYWDGTRWTDHVADAGVASNDPYTEPVATPEPSESTSPESTSPDATSEAAVPDPSGESGATDAPAAALSWAPPSTPSSTSPDPLEPSDAAAPPAAATPSGWSQPSEPAPAEPDGPTEAFPATGWAPTSSPSGWSTDPTGVTPAATAAGAPTEVTPVVDDSPLPDLSGPPAIAGLGGEPPEAVPPVGADPGGGSGGARRNLLIGVGILVVVAVVAFLALSGDDDDSGTSAISNRLADSLQSDSDLSDDDADCVADHIVDQVGPERLEDVDFTSGTAPDGDVGSDFVEAYGDAVRECEVTPGAGDGGGDGGDGGGDTDSDATIPDIGDLDSFRELLADQYEQTLGLPRDKADCLADAMGEAVSKGQLDEQDAFGDFFDYLESCDISLEEITGSAP